jgi:hypothetical protein
VISTELGMLDEAVCCNEIEECLFCCKVVFAAVLLACARLTGCVYVCERLARGPRFAIDVSLTRDGEAEFVGELLEKSAQKCTLPCTTRTTDDHGSELGDCAIVLAESANRIAGRSRGLWNGICTLLQSSYRQTWLMRSVEYE